MKRKVNAKPTKQDEGEKVTITKEDVEVSNRCVTALPAELQDVKPSEIASPLTWALLHTTNGFPLITYEEISIVQGPVADTLRSIYARFRSGESTPEQWFSAALPLLLQLRSEVRNEDAEEIQDLANGQEPN